MNINKSRLLTFIVAIILGLPQHLDASDRDGSDYYKARFSEFENKEVRVKLKSASFWRKDESNDKLSVFFLHTVNGLIDGVVSNENLRAFERKYKNEGFKNRPRVLVGILKKNDRGGVYIEVK